MGSDTPQPRADRCGWGSPLPGLALSLLTVFSSAPLALWTGGGDHTYGGCARCLSLRLISICRTLDSPRMISQEHFVSHLPAFKPIDSKNSFGTRSVRSPAHCYRLNYRARAAVSGHLPPPHGAGEGTGLGSTRPYQREKSRSLSQ